MSERTEHMPGTPSWVDHSSPFPSAAAEFYSSLLGWKTKDAMPPDSGGEYHMARVRGKDVAALSSQADEGAPTTWNTYISVASADEAAAKALTAGGKTLTDPFDVFDAGRMAVMLDSAGAMIMVWEPKRMIGAELVNEPGALCWTELVTDDVEAAGAFYGEVFGWTTSTMATNGADYTLWHLAEGEPPIGGMTAISPDRHPPDIAPHWSICFAVADTDATAARCAELDGTVAVEPFDTDQGRTAILVDPQDAGFAVIALTNPG